MIPSILRNLVCIAVNANKLDAEGAMNLYAAFSSKDSSSFDLHVGENKFDMGKLAFFMASASHRFGVERDKLQAERDRFQATAQDAQQCLSKVLTEQTGANSRVRELQAQVDRLREERNALIKAFAVMGTAEQAKQHAETIERLNALENRVFLGEPRRMVRQSSSRSTLSVEHVPQQRRVSTCHSVTSNTSIGSSRRTSLGDGRSGPEMNPPEYQTASPLLTKNGLNNTGIALNSPSKYQMSSSSPYPRLNDDILFKERFRMPITDQAGKPEIS